MIADDQAVDDLATGDRRFARRLAWPAILARNSGLHDLLIEGAALISSPSGTAFLLVFVAAFEIVVVVICVLLPHA